MSLVKKALATVGIGSAKVDTRLISQAVRPGDVLAGQTFITGGAVDQEVQDLYLDLVITYRGEENQIFHHPVVHYQLHPAFSLSAGEKKVVPFEVPLPWQTPISMMAYPVFLRTGLDVVGFDPTDKDTVNVSPYPVHEQTIAAAEQLGLQLWKVDCEKSYRFGNGVPFVQEFEFRPRGGPFTGQLQELELMFQLSPQGCHVIANVDRRLGGFAGLLDQALDTDERYVRFDLPLNPTGFDLAKTLYDVIQRGISGRRPGYF